MDFHVTFTAVAFLSIISSACSDSCLGGIYTTYLYPSVGSTSIITSLNYPSNYPTPSTASTWCIAAPSGYRVKIKFTSFSTYGSGSCSLSSNDYLEVFGYVPLEILLGRYCGSSLPPILVSSGRYMYLKFSTKSHSARQGFRLEYSVVKQYGCGSTSVSADSSTTKIITYPNNFYPLSTFCEWNITAPSGYVVQIKFTNFNIDASYTGDVFDKFCSSSTLRKLYIYDSSYAQGSKLLGQYCGSFLPANVVSRQRNMFLKFSTSPLPFSKPGFRIEYKAVKDPSEDHSMCSPFNSAFTNNNIKLKASSSYKYIKSPYYPNKYPSNIQCTWIISASSSSKRIKLTLTNVNINNYYSYSCSSTRDSLTIRDGSSSWSTQLKQFCSKSYSSTTVTSKGQKLWIQFKTNSDNYFTSSYQAGFQLKFIEVEDSSNTVGMIVGILFGVGTFIGLIVCCVCISKRKGSAGHVQSNAAAISVQTTTTSTHPPPPAAPQYPLQQVGGYQPPPPGGSYPPPGGSYPPPAMGYPPPAGGLPPPTGSYLPPAGGYPAQGAYPPTTGGYPPPGSSYPPQQQQGGYPPSGCAPYPDIPPPQYPGPPGYPAQSGQPYNPQSQGGQLNPPYPPPQGSENQAAAAATYLPSQDTKASAPPLC